MAEKSQFAKYIQKYFTGYIAKVYRTINGKDKAPSYLYKSMLTPKESVDGKWTSITADNENVVADVVAMDSPFPLKSRPALSTASGDIPKMGMELKMNENQLDQLDTLVAKNKNDVHLKSILTEIFGDSKRIIVGIEEQTEFLFLRGFSSGVALTDSDNVGAGVRVNYRYWAKNKRGVAVVWSDVANSTPITDLNNMLALVDDEEKSVSDLFMAKADFELARKSQEARDLYALTIGNTGTTKPIPTHKQFLEAWEAETDLTFHLINRVSKFELDGKKKSVKAWDAGKVILVNDTNVGDLVWKRTVEANHQSKAIEYREGELGTLISKYVTHKPFGEFTDGQARRVPVINSVDQIFQMDTKEVQA